MEDKMYTEEDVQRIGKRIVRLERISILTELKGLLMYDLRELSDTNYNRDTINSVIEKVIGEILEKVNGESWLLEPLECEKEEK